MKISSMELPPETLSALVDASATINAAIDIEASLQAIAATAATVMHAEASSVMLLDRPRKRLIVKAALGDEAVLLLGKCFDAGGGILGRVVTTGRPELVRDVRNDPDFSPNIDSQLASRIREMIVAPLSAGGNVTGLVQVVNNWDKGSFAESDIELLQVFANLAALGAASSQPQPSAGETRVPALVPPTEARKTIIGQSKALRDVLALCDRVAASNATVLLLGETGTGKELTAHYIHEVSSRRNAPFVAINCAALPETLLESELFGHEKGAFTGAVARKQGRFELASGGTIFLDEIGDISHSTQLKLLRVLQEREFVRVGGTETISCDVRIIAATNRDLKSAIDEGDFRQDLFYRLSVFPIHLPPLRERRDDIPLLVDRFANRSASDLGIGPARFDDTTVAALQAHDWPGNIRELQNVVERAVLLSDDGRITLQALPTELVEKNAPDVFQETSLRGQERALILKALTDAGWNQSKAARALGISRDNLRYRIKKYNIHKHL